MRIPLGHAAQRGFDRYPAGHVDELLDGRSRLLDQIDHRQQKLTVAAQELCQLAFVCLPSGGDWCGSLVSRATPQAGQNMELETDRVRKDIRSAALPHLRGTASQDQEATCTRRLSTPSGHRRVSEAKS